MDKIEFKGHSYPAFQASGFAARFAFPFANEFCKGVGMDIGCMKTEWRYGNSLPIDISFPDPWDAMALPNPPHGWAPHWDYIFSSHCLEHLSHWVDALDYWHTKIKSGGCVFLYLPDHSQVYWRGHHNRKHVHHFTPEIIQAYFEDQPDMWTDITVTNVDLNNSFISIAHKK